MLDDYFDKIYQHPSITAYHRSNKLRNLILVYVESLDSNLQDRQGLVLNEPIDLLPGHVVPEFSLAPGTGWSMAAIVSSQCAIPLKGVSNEDILHPGDQSGRLESVTCLSDVLNDVGYKQVFLISHAATFSGMGSFAKAHHYDHVIGRDEFVAAGFNVADMTSFGSGVHDKDMLEYAENLVSTMVAEQRPFFLSVVITDTHAPEGYPSPQCATNDLNGGFAGVYRCTIGAVAKFARKILEDKRFIDTDLVIMGDHLAPPSKALLASISLPAKRNVYFKIVTYRSLPFLRQKMVHFDVAPTLLSLVGVSPNNAPQFGLGMSLLSSIKDPADHIATVTNQRILNRSIAYEELTK